MCLSSDGDLCACVAGCCEVPRYEKELTEIHRVQTGYILALSVMIGGVVFTLTMGWMI